MKTKKIISVFLILVFVLQLLPIRQVINYFFVDNITVEEIIHTAKAPVKPPTVIDEDHLMNEFHYFEHPYLSAKNIISGLYTNMLPSTHADDVETPPPNC